MTDEYKDFEIAVSIKNCDQDFGLGPGIIGRQVVTPKTDDENKIAWCLNDHSREMIESLVEATITEVTDQDPVEEKDDEAVYTVELLDQQLWLCKDGVGLREASESECDLSRQINELTSALDGARESTIRTGENASDAWEKVCELEEKLEKKEDAWKCQRCGYFNAESVRFEDLEITEGMIQDVAFCLQSKGITLTRDLAIEICKAALASEDRQARTKDGNGE